MGQLAAQRERYKTMQFHIQSFNINSYSYYEKVHCRANVVYAVISKNKFIHQCLERSRPSIKTRYCRIVCYTHSTHTALPMCSGVIEVNLNIRNRNRSRSHKKAFRNRISKTTLLMCSIISMQIVLKIDRF